MDADFILTRKMKRGDMDAMELFIRKYYPIILNYCIYHIYDALYAEDLAQETFERFFGALPGYQFRGKTMNYLYVIAGNLCRDFYKVHVELTMCHMPEQKENPIPAVEQKLDVEGALSRLAPELREVIILYYFQDLKLKEIADILHIGLPLVKYRMKKAKEELRELLGEEGLL